MYSSLGLNREVSVPQKLDAKMMIIPDDPMIHPIQISVSWGE
jgi:hypothetical protein